MATARIKSKSRYVFKSTRDKKNFVRYLKMEISSRKCAELLGVSHQQIVNIAGTICRQWIAEGKLVIKE